MADQPLRWGIMGIGNIARSFAKGLKATPGAVLQAAASNSMERANAFKHEFDVPRVYDNYQHLVEDPTVDVVYIATRHPDHKYCALLCLNHDKPILLEKPFTINASEADEIIELARERNLFVMEAMWMRFLPLMSRIRSLIDEHAIGSLRIIQADFGFEADPSISGRVFDRTLGGGALLDVGVYPISLASMLLGQPSQISGVAHIGATQVDEQSAITLLHTDGAIASLNCSVRARTPHVAHIIGETGSINIHTPWWIPQAMTIHRKGHSEEFVELPHGESGYVHEALEVMRCLREDRIESPMMPVNETLQIMQTMDQLRRQWGLVYPSEE